MGTDIDHVVMAIGMDASKNAWIVQNSWGTDWGIGLSGTPMPVNKYSNCAQMVSESGCSYSGSDWDGMTNGITIADWCPGYCGKTAEMTEGGYIYVEYGANACGIASSAYATQGTSLVN